MAEVPLSAVTKLDAVNTSFDLQLQKILCLIGLSNFAFAGWREGIEMEKLILITSYHIQVGQKLHRS
jgi:hypothetical protein